MPDPTAPLLLDEQVLLGPHPDLDGIDLLVVGSVGNDNAWAAAVHVSTVWWRAYGKRVRDPGMLVVDMKRDVVRAARGLRRIR